MALVLANRVQETATPNTTVSFTLTGAVLGFQTFSVIGNGNVTYYSATDTSGNWEVGIGTYSTTGPTLTRNTVYASSNSGSPVTFPGSVNVFVTYPSGKSVNLDDNGNVSALGTVSSGTWQGSTVGVAYGGTGVTTSSGANSVMLRDSNQNVAINRLNQANTSTTATGGTTVLTAASSYSHTLVGTGNQTFTLPDATTLTTGVAFLFNNMATGTITIQDYASATIGTITAGGAGAVFLINNSTVGGTWDVHGYLPEGVTWGTNALNLGTTVISNGTWQGGTIQPAYGGTGLTTFVGANNALYSTGATTLTAGTLPIAAGGTGNATGLAVAATNIDGGAANRIPYNTAASTTSFIAAPTVASTYLQWTGSAFSWASVASPSSATPTTEGIVYGKTNLFTGCAGGTSALGYQAAGSSPGTRTVAIGVNAGYASQGNCAVAIGTYAGSANSQGAYAVAIGSSAGYCNQAQDSIAIGRCAGATNQGSYAIAIGYLSGKCNQHSGSIAIGFATSTTGGCQTHIGPIRNVASTSGLQSLYYNSTTREITRGAISTAPSVTPNAATFNNSGSGAASGTTFDGSSAVTISYNTIGAPSTSGTNATGTWGISISGNAATATTATTATNQSGGTVSATTGAFSGQVSVSSSYGTMSAVKGSYFGWSSSYGAVIFGSTSGNITPCFNVDPVGNASGAFTGSGNEVMFRNGFNIITPNSGNNGYHSYVTMTSGVANFSATLQRSGNTVLDASNYNSYAPTLTGGGASGTWGISITGNSATVGGYSVSTSGTANTIPTRNSSGYLSPANWIQFDSSYGLYWPNHNGAHFKANDTSSFAPVAILGSRGGYQGFAMYSMPQGGGNGHWMSNGNASGYYNESYGWKFYHESGNLYVYSGTYGGGNPISIGLGGGGNFSNSALGYESLYVNASGSNNTAVGYQSLYNNVNSHNTGVGFQALYYMRGDYNTGVGSYVMRGSTTPANNYGSYTSAFGYQSLYNLSGGYYNAAFGYQSLYSVTTAFSNTGVGYSALYNNQTGNAQTAVGAEAMLYMRGTNNTAVGQASMYGTPIPANNTGEYNTALGVGSLYTLSSGNNNVAIGYRAYYGFSNSYPVTGSNNVAIGYQAAGYGFSAKSGSGNVFVGDQTGYYINSGARNVAVGQFAGNNLNSGSDNVFMGYNAGRAITTGSNNVVLGNAAGYTNSAGSSTNAITTGVNNIYIGSYAYSSGAAVTREIVIGYDTTGKGANTGFINPNGGGVYQGNNSTTWSTTSDARIKQNFNPVTNGLEVINALDPFEFDYILTGKHDVGFKAQQYMTVLPDQVQKHAASDAEKELVGEDEIYGIQRNLDPYLVSAIKSLTEQVKALQQEIAQLKGA